MQAILILKQSIMFQYRYRIAIISHIVSKKKIFMYIDIVSYREEKKISHIVSIQKSHIAATLEERFHYYKTPNKKYSEYPRAGYWTIRYLLVYNTEAANPTHYEITIIDLFNDKSA